jgi:hypothetical protein
MEVQFGDPNLGWFRTAEAPSIGTSHGVYYNRVTEETGSAYFRVVLYGGVDCNGNTIPDDCDISSLTSPDVNMNGIPDECESTCTCGDLDGSGGTVNLSDFSGFQVCFGLRGPTPQCPEDLFDCADLNQDGWINLTDFSTFQVLFGTVSTNSPPNCN